MFNKNNTKIKPESELLALAKFHTMKQDISGESVVSPKEDSKLEDQSGEMTEAKGGSPFLNNEMPTVDKVNEVNEKIASEKEIKRAGFPNFEKINEENNMNTENGGNETNELLQETGEKKHGLVYVMIMIVILLLGIGSYYFFFVREEKSMNEIFSDLIGANNESNSDDLTNNTDLGSNNQAIDDFSEEKNKFSDKVNFMVINDENFDQAGIKSAIDDKFMEMEKYNGSQLEFLLVDQNNTPISFKDFGDNFGLSLKPEITNNLSGDNFSLFLYKNSGVKRVNLVVGVKDEDLLRVGLAKNEETLVNDFSSLFMYDKPESAAQPFKESDYNGKIIRYINLKDNADLSLDYAVLGNYLIVATSKDSGRLIIDKLSDESSPRGDIFTPTN